MRIYNVLFMGHVICYFWGEVVLMEDINVKILDMDTMVPEHLVKNADDTYTIFINARLSQESRLKSYLHALNHIKNRDFEKFDVQEIEKYAHKI